MAAGIGFRRVALALIASLLALGIPMVAGLTARADGSDRPPQSVALARVAVVRVLTYYYGTTSANPAPIPVLAPCASDGVLVGTTDQSGNLNSTNYVLTPTAAVNPLVPCQGAQAAFQQLNGNATSWGITRIVVALNVAYTGTEGTQRGSITYSISPGLVTTNGGPGAPALLALSLSNATGAPSHDLPVLSIPQPSDAPASGTPEVIDLTGKNGEPLNRDAVRENEINDTLYPISVSADKIPQAPAPKGAKTPGATAAITPTAVGNSIGIGAAEVDSNGRLVGMVVRESNGNHVLASLADVKKAIGSVSGHPGALMTAWQNGISAFYASSPNYDAAASAFHGLLSSAPDFAGAKPFLDAAQQHTTTIPSLTQGAPPPPGSILPGLSPSSGISVRTLLVVGGGIGAGVAVLAVVLVVLQRGRRARMPVYMPAPLDEAGLDLLPRDSMYEIPAIETPQAMPAVRPPQQSRSRPHSQPRADQPDIEDMPTGLMPTMPPARSATGAPGARYTMPIPPDFGGDPRAPSQSRKNTSLMSYAAGLTHPGIRRANDPNQDNMLALHGVRLAGSRPQPYGLFVVADGMGGHLNGQEASRLAIEIITRIVMQTLNTSQPIDGSALSGVLREGVQQANNELRRRNINERADMGTTITA
ncbi:MAG TPA: hypothetical protein VFW17_00450, partial [Ktedonobacterales bacterium]|nr:hypothetical protein [Ktedonobacterales bacterium]